MHLAGAAAFLCLTHMSHACAAACLCLMSACHVLPGFQISSLGRIQMQVLFVTDIVVYQAPPRRARHVNKPQSRAAGERLSPPTSQRARGAARTQPARLASPRHSTPPPAPRPGRPEPQTSPTLHCVGRSTCRACPPSCAPPRRGTARPCPCMAPARACSCRVAQGGQGSVWNGCSAGALA